MPSDEITVLPADPEKPAIGWTVQERSGFEVYLKPSAPPYIDLPPITEKDGLKAGDEILVPSIFGGTFLLMIVEKDEHGELYGSSNQLMAILEFGKDDRHAWVCDGLINTRGLEKLQLRK